MIDAESKKFIAWAIEQLKDVKSTGYNVVDVMNMASEFYEDMVNNGQIHLMHLKLEKGALEYGFLETDRVKLYQNLYEEFLDILGWFLIIKYVENRQNEKKD